MIEECKQYLTEKLNLAGIKTTIYYEQKHLENSNEHHIGAVLLQKE